MAFCEFCGSELEEGVNFCTKCGAEVADQQIEFAESEIEENAEEEFDIDEWQDLKYEEFDGVSYNDQLDVFGLFPGIFSILLKILMIAISITAEVLLLPIMSSSQHPIGWGLLMAAWGVVVGFYCIMSCGILVTMSDYCTNKPFSWLAIPVVGYGAFYHVMIWPTQMKFFFYTVMEPFLIVFAIVFVLSFIKTRSICVSTNVALLGDLMVLGSTCMLTAVLIILGILFLPSFLSILHLDKNDPDYTNEVKEAIQENGEWIDSLFKICG